MYNRFGGSYYRPAAPPAYAMRGFMEHRAPVNMQTHHQGITTRSSSTSMQQGSANPFRRSSAYAVLGSSQHNQAPMVRTSPYKSPAAPSAGPGDARSVLRAQQQQGRQMGSFTAVSSSSQRSYGSQYAINVTTAAAPSRSMSQNGCVAGKTAPAASQSASAADSVKCANALRSPVRGTAGKKCASEQVTGSPVRRTDQETRKVFEQRQANEGHAESEKEQARPGVQTRSRDTPALLKPSDPVVCEPTTGHVGSQGQSQTQSQTQAKRDTGPTPGRVTDKYVMENLLGDGTFAKVYRCRHRETGAEHAAKVIDLRRWRGNADVMKGLRREIGILRSLDHPSVVRLEEWYESNDEIVLVTDIVRGGDLLDRLLSTGALPEKEARSIFRRVLEAVRYLHERGIVHRDLKPENLLCVSKSGPELKLCDFGQSARLSERDSSSGGSFGTYEYVAPEAIRRAPYDRPMDMWSAGVILFILLAGIFPFEGNGQDALFRSISSGRYRLPSRFERSLSRDAKDLIARLLNVSPSRRITVQEALQHPWFAGSQ